MGEREVLVVGRDTEVRPVFGRDDVAVEHVETSSAALDRLPVDCIVSQHSLPDRTGVDLCRTVRGSSSDARFVLVPAESDPELAREAVSAGVDRFLPMTTLKDGRELGSEVADLLAVDETQRRYRRLVEETTDLITVLDPDGNIQYANPSVEEMLGVNQSDLAGMSRMDFVHPEDRNRVQEAFENRVAGDSDRLSLEYRIENVDGEWCWIESRALSYIEDPAIEGVVVSSREITNRKERERELERSRDFLEQTQKVAKLGGWSVDLQSEMSRWTDEVNRIHGVPTDYEPTIEEGIEFYHPEDRPVVRNAFERLTEDGDPYDLELRIVTTDDETKWVRTRGEPIYEDGEIIGARGVFQDITERKEQEGLYSTLVDKANDGIVIVVGEEIEFCNEEIAEMVGTTPEDAEGRSAFEFISESDQDTVKQAYARRASGEVDSTRYEIDLKTVDGERIPVEVSSSLVQYEGDTATLTIIRDMTERKQRERELELYERMLNAVPDMVYALDQNGRFIAINETGEAMIDRAETDIVGRNVAIVMNDDDRERGRKHIQALLVDDDREKAIYEMDLHDAHGESIPVENHVALLWDDGEFGGSVGVIRDVRERKRRENRLTVLNRALRHDLRNSMHVILANAELLEHSIEDEEIISRLRTIERRAQSINNISEKAREIEQTLAQDEELAPVNVATLTRNLLVYFRQEYPNVEFEVDIPEQVWARATPLIDTAIENLIENAIEHTEDPRIHVAVDPGDDGVTITVADDGPGIPEKERRIVEQGNETPLDHASGLGLWLVSWITSDSGGEIDFEDSDEWGSVVTLTLEHAEAAPQEASESLETDV